MRRMMLAALLLAGCGPAAEREPNDHFTQATPLKAGARARGTMASAADVDVYRLEVRAEGGTLTARVGGIKSVDFVLSFQDSERRELKRFDETGAGGDETAVDLGVRRGVYYLALSNNDPKADNPRQEYVLETALGPAAGREAEPDDNAASASPLPAGGVVTGHYFPSRNLLSPDPEQAEEDWYRIEVPAAGLYTLNADLSEVPKVDAVLEVYDSNAYKVGEADLAGPGLPESLRDLGVRGPAAVLLRVRAKLKAGSADLPYQLLTELVPYQGRAEFEPNDQRPDATPFEGEAIRGRLGAAGDADWFRVEVGTDAKQLLRAELSAVPGLDLVLVLADELGEPVLTADNGGRDQPELLTGAGVRRGVYHLIVTEISGKRADTRQEYTLSKALAPFQEGLEFELNDSTASAQAVKVGEAVDGYFAPKGDVDWYEFNVYAGGVVSLELTGVVNVRPVATLYDQEYRELESKAAGKRGEGLALARELSPGTYALRLAPESPEQNNIRDKYTLRIRAR